MNNSDLPVRDQTGADYETVECFLRDCHRRLRKGDLGLPQFCSRSHRAQFESVGEPVPTQTADDYDHIHGELVAAEAEIDRLTAELESVRTQVIAEIESAIQTKLTEQRQMIDELAKRDIVNLVVEGTAVGLHIARELAAGLAGPQENK